MTVALQLLITAAWISCFGTVAKFMRCKYGPEGIIWVNQKAGLGSEAAGKCLLQYFGP